MLWFAGIQDKARKCFWQLLQALHILHSNNIVHHDVKLENILLQKSNDLDVVKLVDFGLSHVTGFHGLHDWFVRTQCAIPLMEMRRQFSNRPSLLRHLH